MKKLKVLIAEDELMLQEIYMMVLETNYACEFVCVTNADEGIEAIKNQGPFDLILSDYRMPAANGGKLYLFNKTLHNSPFFLFSGGFLHDYCEFTDFYQSNPHNHFLGKPFNEEDLLSAIEGLEIKEIEPSGDQLRFIKVNLRHYLNYTASAAEVYIKLHDDKFTKIIDANSAGCPEKDLLLHYLDKGINTIYIDKNYFHSLMRDIFSLFQKKLLNEKKKETIIELGEVQFKVCFEGLRDIGMTSTEIDRASYIIHHTVLSILSDEAAKERFKTYCSLQGFGIGHSLLIMYIASSICHESGLNFPNTMKRICTAAFYHDFSLFETNISEDNLPLEKALNQNALFNHPGLSAEFLPSNLDFFEDTRKIILEHHEKPNGDGYPKKLNSHTISPLSCLFILSQEITFNLIRNDFDKDRLRDFLTNVREDYSGGNFGKFYKACETIFELNT